MALELKLDGLREKTRGIKAQEQADETGDDVKVILLMPDGSEALAVFKMGTLVSYVKAYVNNEFGHPMAKMVLLLEDRPMLDPLCLSDIPGVTQSGVNHVKVSMDA
ncbi:hypothetical protein BSKO_08033 [Bryopsis sp. KO-2023]|nr:hypothetical protein BSKO_08033 [Bryopsis sp. KO-2023]